MFSRRLLGVGFIVGFGLIVAVTYGVVVSADNAWGKLHWDADSLPVHLTLGDNFDPSAWGSAYDTAVADWNVSAVLELEKVDGETSPSDCNPANGTIEVCADTYGINGWLGLAQVWARGPHIRRALAKMNDSYFSEDFAEGYYNDPAWRALVMCQEIGHDFGLDHQDENFTNMNLGSCMDYTNVPGGGVVDGFDWGLSNLSADDHDRAELDSIYAHLDGGGGGGKEKPCKPASELL